MLEEDKDVLAMGAAVLKLDAEVLRLLRVEAVLCPLLAVLLLGVSPYTMAMPVLPMSGLGVDTPCGSEAGADIDIVDDNLEGGPPFGPGVETPTGNVAGACIDVEEY